MIGWEIFPIFTIVAVVAGVVGSIAAWRGSARSATALWSMWLATATLLIFIVGLWTTLDRPPMRTMGETRLWYSFFLLFSGSFTYHRWGYRWVPTFATMLATVFMVINCLKPEIHDTTLMPALQSAWFIPHVAIYMFAYALLGCATLLSIYSLFGRKDVDRAMESLLYGGVAFLTVGMLTGALWAKQAWGDYWSWDAKESWAAATWLLYLLAIHLLRLKRGGRGVVCAVIVVAFLSLQMCWYGVNYLPTAKQSVHVYNR
ncbi:MAG: cytochrome c biogenesis protein CcsA [Alistipes sp.]|nr:cytochrome c biogenesis protein CcsA [Alistipes sp.]